MSTAWLGLGSNVNADSNIRAGIRGLIEEFENVVLSPAYTSAAVGFEGDDFINLVARVETNMHPLVLRDFLRDLEAIVAGREPARMQYATPDLIERMGS